MNIRLDFRKAAQEAFRRGIVTVTQTYPSKFVGLTALAGDIGYFLSTISHHSPFGIASSIAFIASSGCLLRYGDPKITAEQSSSYVDPQDAPLGIVQRALLPSVYPWETFALVRIPAFVGMTIAGCTGGHWTESATGLLCLIAAGFKFVPEQARSDDDAISNQFAHSSSTSGKGRVMRYILTNPVRSAGICYNLSNIPYIGGAIITTDYPKIVSGLTYVVPDMLTLFGKKRTQIESPKVT